MSGGLGIVSISDDGGSYWNGGCCDFRLSLKPRFPFLTHADTRAASTMRIWLIWSSLSRLEPRIQASSLCAPFSRISKRKFLNVNYLKWVVDDAGSNELELVEWDKYPSRCGQRCGVDRRLKVTPITALKLQRIHTLNQPLLNDSGARALYCVVAAVSDRGCMHSVLRR